MDTIQIRLRPDQIQLAADMLRAARDAGLAGDREAEAFELETRLRYRIARARAGARPQHPARA